tara:strand:- start:1284 stop:1514 length:231 start_codon:yes stop_codon:yes gene_type:complete
MKLGKRQQAIITSLENGSVDSIRSESLTGKYYEIINGEAGAYVPTSSMDSLVFAGRFTTTKVARWGITMPSFEYSL